MNYKVVMAYDGTRYDGWQKQGNTEATIQGKLEAILEKMCGETVEVHGAGRTDAGVHARGQVANFRLHTDKSEDEIKEYINRYLPEDIAVCTLERAESRFHSRLNAIGKIYCYRIGRNRAANLFERKYMYGCYEQLDINAMKEAAALMVGEHDFKAFCSNKHMKKSTVRTVYSITIEEKEQEIDIRFHGNGFLYNMIRIMTGTLLEVGRGERSAQSVKEIQESKDRQKAGKTAPACGLVLEKVLY